MYFNRNSVPAFTKSQFKLRALKLALLDNHNLGLQGIITNLEEIILVVNELSEATSATFDGPYFKFLESFFSSIKFQAAYLQALKSGDSAADSLKKANQFNHEHLKDLAEKLDSSRPSVKALSDLAAEISDCSNLIDFFTKADKLARTRLPFVNGIEMNPYADFRRHVASEDKEEDKEPEPLLLSVRFLTDNELWANPQVLKPNAQYAISGLIKLNRLPENYNKLIIRHVSTTSDEFFILSLPEIELTNDLEYHISGQIIFKYPQSTFDPPIAVRLIAQMISLTEPPIYPYLIGYDELIAQVIDEKTFTYPTGFSKLNRKALDIGLEIKKDLPHIAQEEVDYFLIILSATLNYSGYCANYGIYKGVSTLSEDEFRDRLIAHLSANPMIGGDIVKEGNIAGGRVEIRYKNIISELKVERSITDRTKMVDRYKRQPSVYASAVSAELAILCILDLTPKTLPPAPAANNIFMIPAVFHGFDNASTTSKVAVIIIDGNLKDPSAY